MEPTIIDTLMKGLFVFFKDDCELKLLPFFSAYLIGTLLLLSTGHMARKRHLAYLGVIYLISFCFLYSIVGLYFYDSLFRYSGTIELISTLFFIGLAIATTLFALSLPVEFRNPFYYSVTPFVSLFYIISSKPCMNEINVKLFAFSRITGDIFKPFMLFFSLALGKFIVILSISFIIYFIIRRYIGIHPVKIRVPVLITAALILYYGIQLL